MSSPRGSTGLLGWLDARSGWVTGLRRFFAMTVPGGPSISYVFGFTLAMAFFLQTLTGVLLAFHFVPSSTDAWGSVYFIQNEVTLGWLIRGAHHFGASAVVVLLVLHMTQTFLAGAYRAPRELNWLSGVMLLAVVLGFSLTGYLLPWDQKGYWATRVATGIMGTLPGVGGAVQQLAMGGTDYGNATLSRFYATHVFVLPALLFGLLAIHVGLHRRHGYTPLPWRPAGEAGSAPFWPGQALLNLFAVALVVVTLVVLSLTLGASLEAPADQSADYEARPEWYYLFLFQLLKIFEGPLTLVGTVVLPGAVGAFLMLLPFLDRKGDRHPRARLAFVVPFLGGLVGVGGLTAQALLEDARDPAVQDKQALARIEAAEAARYAGVFNVGIDAEGKVVLFEGKRVFRREKCGECHQVGSPDPGRTDRIPKSPRLDGYLSRAWIRGFLENPSADERYGRTKLRRDEDAGTGMPAFAHLGPDALDALTELIASQSGLVHEPPINPERVAAAAAPFDAECSTCHTLDGTAAAGPSLQGYGSAEWLRGLLKDPTHERFYGPLGSGMPRFDHLSAPDTGYLIAWLQHLRLEPQ